VAALLDAAACVIAKNGYETATMTEIAQRAGSCIGSLYQFFPNKQAISQALRARYGREIEQMWAPLEAQCSSLTVDQMVSHLTTGMVGFIKERPAFLPLLDAPACTRNLRIRQHLRQQLVRCFVSMRPRLPLAKAMQMASVCLQMIKSMNQLYAETAGAERKAIIEECRFALTCYLTSRLQPERRLPREQKK
jgi:AcrR family transcriptional regulator